MNEKIIKEIKSEIDKAKKILLHCHPSPDPDSVGSSLAMKLALEKIGKNVTLIRGDSEIPKEFKFPGIESIVHKSFFDIDIKEFDLFIILDSASIDRVSSLQEVKFPENLMTIVIDHHVSNPGFAKINLIDSSYPATSQILFDLFNSFGIEIDHDIATNLFIGIYTDTGGFKYRSSTPTTLKIASELAFLAPDYIDVIFAMENSHRKESLVFEGIAYSSIKTYLNGKMGLAYVSNDLLKENNITEDDISTSYISNKIKSIEEIEIAVTLVEKEPNRISVSFRSKRDDLYDVSKLAVSLGGGGHKSASGAMLKMSLPEAIDNVVKNAQKIYNV